MSRKKSTRPNLSDDEAFFLRFYEENKGFLFYTAQKYTDNASDREDIVQETVVRLLSNIDALRALDRNRRLKYIALTVRSAFVDNQRKKRSDQWLSVDDRMLEALLRKERISAPPSDPVSARLEVLALKQSLPERDWMVLEGRYILGYSYEELSQQMGLPQDHIRVIVSRAKEKARRLLLSASEKGGNSDGR